MTTDSQNTRSDRSQPPHKTWALKTGAVFGGLTLIFLMTLVFLSISGSVLNGDDKYLVLLILALGCALSVSFLGGEVAARGEIPLPFATNSPVSFGVTSGVAILVIVLILGSLLYLETPPEETAEAEAIIEWRDKLYASPNKVNVLLEIEECGKLYNSWGGKYNYEQINEYLTYFENIGKLFKDGVFSKELLDRYLGEEIVITYINPEVKRYIAGIRKNAGQPNAAKEFYELAEDLKGNHEDLVGKMLLCGKNE